MDNVIDGKFRKRDGRKRGAGRPPGSPNKTTQILKDALSRAARRIESGPSFGPGLWTGPLSFFLRNSF
jgi:hypothetical protein